MATPPAPPATNDTHDPSLKSWVESANDPATEYPIQNLPLCSFEQEHDGHRHAHLGVLIGDQVLDVSMLAMAGRFGDPQKDEVAHMLHSPYWNPVAGRPQLWSPIRRAVQEFLRADGPAASGGQPMRRLRQKAVVPQAGTRFLRPLVSFDYTDFYASKHHATNVGSMFRPDNPLLPNYAHVPIGYHGRASSIVMSGAEVRRPNGQTKPDDAAAPSFGPSKMLDYEMELGVYVGAGNRLGEPVDIAGVSQHLFGMCILNDWSARDVQKWEYQPLGPFLAKSFASTVSPCVVTMEALQPFRVAGPERDASDPEPLPYLRTGEAWGLDVTVEVWLRTETMRAAGHAPAMLSRASFRRMFWTVAQMVAHHASNGCNLQPGDLLGSGTISGPERSERGCLLELTFDGIGPDGKPKRTPVQLPGGETRTFLQDGDEVVMRAYCERDGFRRIGFGECRGKVVAAPTPR